MKSDTSGYNDEPIVELAPYEALPTGHSAPSSLPGSAKQSSSGESYNRMTDIHDVVARIRDNTQILEARHAQGNDVVSEEMLGQLERDAHLYACFVEHFNRRIRIVEDMLRNPVTKKNADKAISQEPHLHEMFMVLQFPEVDAWMQITVDLALECPLPLNPRAEEILSEGTDRANVIKQLINHQRLLALQNASVDKRLSVLRNLVTLDPHDPMWVEDITSLEAARLTDLPQEVAQAIKSENPQSLVRLHKELTETDWIKPPPGGLAEQVSTQLEIVKRRIASGKIAQLVAELSDAVDNKKEADIRRIASTIKSICLKLSLKLKNPDHLAVIQRAVDWIDQQNRFRQACESLAQAVDSRLDADGINERVVAMREFSEPIPEALAMKVNAYCQTLERRACLKRRWTRIGVAAGILLVTGLSILFVLNHRLQKAVDVTKNQIQTYLSTEQYDKAQQMFDALKAENSAVWQSDTTQDMYKKFAQAQARRKKTEDDRQQRFASCDQTLARKQAKKSLEDQVCQERLRDMKSLAKTAKEAKHITAKKAKRITFETERITFWEGAIAAHTEMLQKKKDEAHTEFKRTFLANKAKMHQELRRFQQMDEKTDGKTFQKQLGQVNGAILAAEQTPEIPFWKQLAAKMDDSQEGDIADAKQTRDDHVEQISKASTREEKRLLLLNSIFASNWPLSSIRQKMTQYTDDYPNASESAPFTKRLTEMSDLDAMIDWNAMIQKGGASGKWGTDVPARLNALAEYQEKYPNTPVSSDLEAIKTLYQKCYVAFHGSDYDPDTHTEDDEPQTPELAGAKADSELAQTLTDPNIGVLNMLLHNGNYYYFTEYGKATINDKVVKYTLKVIEDIEDTTDTKEVRIPSGAIHDESMLKKPAPFIAAYEAAAKHLQAFTPDFWATEYLELMQIIFKAQGDIDPIIRASMMLRLMSEAQTVVPDAKMAAMLQRECDKLQRVGLDQVEWYSANTAEAKETRKKCVEILKKLPKPDELLKTVQKIIQACRKIGVYTPTAIVRGDGKPTKVKSGYLRYVYLDNGKLIPIKPDKDGIVPSLRIGTVIMGAWRE